MTPGPRIPAVSAPPRADALGLPSWMWARRHSVNDSIALGRLRGQSRRAALPTAVALAAGEGPSRPNEPVTLGGIVRDREGRASEYGNADRDVSEVDADGNDDHDIHDIQDEGDGDDGDVGDDVHDIHDIQDTACDRDDDSDSDDDDCDLEEPDAARFRYEDDPPGRTTQFAVPDLQLGVIGCGEIAQILYLPHLSSLTETGIAAISDLSRERLEHVGNQYGVSHRYQGGLTLIGEHHADLDGVVICTPPHTHADLAARALDAGLATFVEAPLAVTPDEAWELDRRAKQAEVPAMVGYPRRYDPAYHQFTSVLERSDSVRYVDAYDVNPVDPRIRTVHDPVPAPLPQAVAAEADRIRTRQAKDALGTETDWIAAAYLSHLGQLCHTVNLLRGLYGDVSNIYHASLDGPGEFLTAELGYESGTGCHLTSGRTDGEWFEEYVRVDTADRMVRLDCSDPYRRNSPSAVTIVEGTDEVVTRTHVPRTEEPVKRELASFLDAIREGKPTQTPFVDAAKDVEMIADLVYRGTAGMGASQ